MCGLIGFISGIYDLFMVIYELKKFDLDNEFVKFILVLKKVDNLLFMVGLDEFKKVFEWLGENVYFW